MEYIIGMILGICAGLIGLLIFSRRKNSELDSLKKENEKLSVDLEDTERGKVTLEGELTEKTAQIDALESGLTEKTAQIDTLESELTEKTTQIETLMNQLERANTQIETLDSQLQEAGTQIEILTNQLDRANTQIDTLTNELERANTQIDTLTNQLKGANTQIDTLTNQMRRASTQIDTLTNQLKGANTQIDTLTNQLQQVSESNANALKVLHLFELSLQLNTFVLYSEVSRTTYLAKKYEKLYEEYKGFLEEVEKRARRRLMRTGITAALSLIPGVGVVQLASDLAELADFVGKVAEGTTDVSDVSEAVDSSLNIMNSLGEFISFAEIGVLQAEMASDQDREKVIQEYQSVFEEAFSQNQGPDLKEPDASDFDNFLKALILRMKVFVDSMPENEQRNALNRIVRNFRQFGIRLYPYAESSEIRADRSLPPPKD